MGNEMNKEMTLDELDSIAGGRVLAETNMEKLINDGISVNLAHKDALKKELLAEKLALRVDDLANVTGGAALEEQLLAEWPEDM